MSTILCLETSAKACSVALSQDGVCLAYKTLTEEWKHSKMITLLISEVLKEAGLDKKQLSAIAISGGPGSYTGLRVGASCGKGLCYGLDLPLISIPTLEIVAFPFKESDMDMLVPMIDARRMEVYHNIYSKDLKELNETTNLILEEGAFVNFIDKKLLFCGDGAFKMKGRMTSTGWKIADSFPEARNMCQIAAQKYQNAAFEDLAYFVPFYLKPPNITKSTKALF